MLSVRSFLSSFPSRMPVAFALAAFAFAAHAQADPPARVARLNLTQGAVVFAPAGDTEWVDAQPNRPITRGDRLWTDRGARAELQVGSSAVRLDGQTRLEIVTLDDDTAQVNLLQGSVYLRVRSLPEGETIEVDTPNAAWRVAYPGDFRIDVDAANATTRVTVHAGTGTVYGEDGQALPLGGGQQVTFRGRTLSQVTQQESPPQDNFDRWAFERNRREDQSPSARHVPREVVGYIELDSQGQWQKDATHGDVWIPQSVPPGWAPYRNGRWEWISPWGWTWIDDAPWGFAPFHYGRWALFDGKWAWVPGRLDLKPVYAPALVAFVGNDAAGSSVSLSSLLLGNKPGVAWFPLAPGEAWLPAYKASARYLAAVNRDAEVQATYANQRKVEALTAIAQEDFQRGKPAKAGWLRVAANMIGQAQIVPPPPKPERKVVVTARPSKLKVPAPASDMPPVAAKEAPEVKVAKVPAPAASALAPAQARAPAPAAPPAAVARVASAATPAVASASKPPAVASTSPARAASMQRRVAVEPRKEVAKREEARRQNVARKEQAHREAVARRDEARRQQAARADDARRQLAARKEQARREEQARRDEKVRRELAARQKSEQVARDARRAEQQRKEVVARRDELQRQQHHAQQVEQARKAAERDAQQLREQRERAEREQLARRELEREAQRGQAARDEQAQREQREQAQREAALRQQQAIAEQQRRERAERARQRPDLRQYVPQS